jgi:hypothetical protein
VVVDGFSFRDSELYVDYYCLLPGMYGKIFILNYLDFRKLRFENNVKKLKRIAIMK